MNTIKKQITQLKALYANGLLYVLISNSVKTILGFGTTFFVVHMLSKTEYGIYTYSWNIYSIIFLFNGMGMESGVLQLISENNTNLYEARKILYLGIKYGLGFNILLSFILLFLGLFVPLPVSSSGKMLNLMMGLPFCQVLNLLILVYFRALKEFKKYYVVSLITSVSNFLLTCLFVYLFREYGIILGLYASCVLSVLFCFLLYYSDFKYTYDDYNVDKKSLIKISVVSMLSNGCSGLMYLLDIFVLGFIVRDESVLADYKVATIIPSAMIIIPNSLVMFIYPYFAEKKDDKSWCKKKSADLISIFGIFNFVLSAALFFLSPYILNVFGSKYCQNTSILRVLFINYFISSTFRIILGNLLVTQRKIIFNLVVTVISGILNVILDCIFISLYGGIGAAWATVIANFIISMLLTIYWCYTISEKK